jgi:diaminopimelate epimerase
MQGAGNDFVCLSVFAGRPEQPAELARRLCRRRYGVGADGLLLIGPSDRADFRMELYNADGSRAQMCGNGIRCAGKFAFETGIARRKCLHVETDAGIRDLELIFSLGTVAAATVDMGAPIFAPAKIPVDAEGDSFTARPVTVCGVAFAVTALSMGNPHAVVFTNRPDQWDLPVVGPQFERHPLFPQGVNTEFVQVLRPDLLKMRVWERGVGETLSCGTGACAALVAAAVNGCASRAADVLLPGGVLGVRWEAGNGRVYLTGPAVTVFEGAISER